MTFGKTSQISKFRAASVWLIEDYGITIGLFLLGLLLTLPPTLRAEPPNADYPWLSTDIVDDLDTRIETPPGFSRIAIAPGSFAEWLRRFPVKPVGSQVHLFDGRQKAYQRGQYAILDIDVGDRDLQQCADAVIRMRAEYLWARHQEDAIAFDFTSGDRAHWTDWRDGLRPIVDGDRVHWTRRSDLDESYENLRRYLERVFTYAGSHSLSRELDEVADPKAIEPGDVFIQGGFPGHAVLVVDVAVNSAGERAFLLAQSYMPAQDVHVLVNPASPSDPWCPAKSMGSLETPEWIFDYRDLRRFASSQRVTP